MDIDNAVENAGLGWLDRERPSMGRTKFAFVDLDSIDWITPRHRRDGLGAGVFPEAVVEQVDLAEFLDGSRVKAMEFPTMSLLEVELPPGHLVPRHHHNLDQMVFVRSGSAIFNRRSLGVGQGWYTPAGETYSFRSGSEGLTYLEVRNAPLASLETIWDEQNPARWRHAKAVGE